MEAFPQLLFCFSLSLILTSSTATDTINTTQPVRDGDTIASPSGTFELGFFSLGSSKNRYLGIWYGKIPVRTVVWVANRENPLNDSSGVLRITNNGILDIVNENGSIIWSSNSSGYIRNPLAQLLDTGNLIVKDEEGDTDPENFLWQSFEHPFDTALPGRVFGRTMLPGLKIGLNLRTGKEWYLTSWNTLDDPSPGTLTLRLKLGGYPEFFIRKGSVKHFRLGPWNGLRFSGLPQVSPNSEVTYQFVFDEEEIYWSYHVLNNSLFSRLVLNYDGSLLGYQWIERAQNWIPFRSANINDCDNYALCGVFSICNANSAPFCNCLKGFTPKIPKEQSQVGWSNGCVRTTPLNCSEDGFQKYAGVKLPETQNSWFNRSMNLQECEYVCKRNCSCTAYANLDIRDGGSGCLIWFDDLVDLRQFSENGQDIYIRLAASELDHVDNNNSRPNRKTRNTIIIILTSVLPGVVLLLGLALLLYLRKKKQQKGQIKITKGTSTENKCEQEDLELPLFDLVTIASATNDFNESNKLGEGGFGPVHKGRLEDGQEIAVKRLSKSSRQGLQEFKNEVKYIAKLQHRNLVKLLGCCIEGDEKMLIYEFMPNKSLDLFIFDQTINKELNWQTRCHIIIGIARGLLYLHQDSRLKIIHRDLKASNILLDYEMNPKISDFGLARSFGMNESHANTNKVVGTYGYMSPEYAIDGHYSTKSDVFSFGVMVLEILSGKRNRGFRHPEHNLNLLGHAWILHQEGRAAELIAEPITDLHNISEVLRTVHISLLCVQRSPEDRPSISTVIVMLDGEGALPQPKQPGFFNERDIIEEVSSSTSNHMSYSTNNLTITVLNAR